MNTIVYHWFGETTDDPDVAKNMRCPLITSIATLRAVDKKSKIVVLNASELEVWLDQEWKPYTEILNFEVEYIDVHLAKNYSEKPGYKHLSRLFDISRFDWGKKTNIFYSDSDVFWLKPPFPVYKDINRFCFDGYNTGIFYFNNNSPIVEKFFELFEAYTISALNNFEIRQKMKQYVGYDAWYFVWDEMIATFMFNEHQELISQISKEEHCCARDLRNIDVKKIKAFHCNGLMIGDLTSGEKHARGLAGILIKEWWDAINSVIDPTMIYTKDALDEHLPLQFSLLNNPERITSTLSNDGHYYLNKL